MSFSQSKSEMSLYHEACSFLAPGCSKTGSLKSRIFNPNANLTSSPSAVYALVIETAKYDILLKEMIENSGILALEPKVIGMSIRAV